MNPIICNFCGHPIHQGAAFCAKCGAPAPAPAPASAPATPSFCGHCGNSIAPGTAFCARCGTRITVPTLAPTPAPTPIASETPGTAPLPMEEPKPVTDSPETETVCEIASTEADEFNESSNHTSDLEPPAKEAIDPVPQPELQPAPTAQVIRSTKPRKKRPIWARILCGFGSSILLTIAILIGLVAGTVFMVRDIVSTDSIREMISDVDLTSMEIEVDGKSLTVSDAIHDAFKEAQNEGAQAIDPDAIDELLKAEFVVDFMATTIGSYAEAVTDGAQVKDLSAQDVELFLTDNRSEIETILDVELTDEMIQDITSELEETEILEELSVSKVIGEIPDEVATITKFFSQEIVLIACASMLLFLLLIALINFFRPISLSYAGAAFLTVGGIFGLITLLLEGLITLLSDLFNLPASILDFAIGGISSAAFNVFLIGAITGLLFIAGAIVYTVLRSVRRKKLYA